MNSDLIFLNLDTQIVSMLFNDKYYSHLKEVSKIYANVVLSDPNLCESEILSQKVTTLLF